MLKIVKLITILLIIFAIIPASVFKADTTLDVDNANIIFLPMINRGQALPPADEASQYITLPERFEVRIFADNLPASPRMMAFGPDGNLYVSLMHSGQIARLPDANQNGIADRVEIVASGLELPHGIEFYNDMLYIAEYNMVTRYKDYDEDGDFEKDCQFGMIPLPSGGMNYTRTLHFGPDGNLYVSAGSYSNIDITEDPRYGAILRFTPEGEIPPSNPFYNDINPRKQVVWADGLRYSVDFLWTPAGDLWANHNGSDGWENGPPEEVVINVQKGMHHGWPFCYTPDLGIVTQNETKYPNITSGWNCDEVIPAIYTTQAHASPLGMALGGSWLFPQEYQDSLYMSYGGSGDDILTSSYPDCMIERIILQDGLPIGEETFASFYHEPGQECGAYGSWGHPVDIVFGPNGDMYVSDDIGMRIYRIIYIP